MKPASFTHWKRNFNIDTVANFFVVATCAMIILLAAVTADPDPADSAMMVAQKAQKEADRKIAVNPLPHPRVSGEQRIAGYGDSARLVSGTPGNSVLIDGIKLAGGSHVE
jgi:hypothetical protein